MRARSSSLFRPKVKAAWVAIAAGSLAGLAVLGACSDAPISKIAGPKIPEPRFGQIGLNAHNVVLCLDQSSTAGSYTFSVARTTDGDPTYSYPLFEPINGVDQNYSTATLQQLTFGPWAGDKILGNTSLATANVTLNSTGVANDPPDCVDAFVRATTSSNSGNRMWNTNPGTQSSAIVNPFATVVITPVTSATYTANCVNDNTAQPQTPGCLGGPISATTIYSSANVFHGSVVTYVATNTQTGPCVAPNAAFGLGSAGAFTLLGLAGNLFDVGSGDTYVLGDAGIGPNNTGTMKKATINGNLVKDPSAATTIVSDLKVTGTKTTASLLAASNAGYAASTALGAMAPTQTFGNLINNTTFNRTTTTNVIAISSVNMVSKTITINGGANDVFIFNVSGAFSFRSSRMVLTGGITPHNILWNFTGNTGDVVVKDLATTAYGIFLAPARNVNGDKATITGALISGTSILIHSGTQLLCQAI